MNKKQLLDELGKKFHRVGNVSNADSSPEGRGLRKAEGFNCYLVSVYERNNDIAIRRNIGIYVENENKQDERAFYAERMPENTLQQQPAKSRFSIVDGVIEQETKDYAIVKRFVVVRGVAEEKRFLIREVAGKLAEYPIKEQKERDDMSMPIRRR